MLRLNQGSGFFARPSRVPWPALANGELGFQILALKGQSLLWVFRLDQLLSQIERRVHVALGVGQHVSADRFRALRRLCRFARRLRSRAERRSESPRTPFARLLHAALSEIAHFIWNLKRRIGHSLPSWQGGRKWASTVYSPIAQLLLQCNIFGAATILTLKTMRRTDAVAKIQS